MGLTLLEIQALTASLAANGRVPSTVPAPAATTDIEGIIPAAGTTATAGTGFAYTHTNGTGVYVFTFTSAFQAAPAVVATANGIGGGGVLYEPLITSVTAAGFTVTMTNTSNAGADVPFTFIAKAVT